MQQHKLRVKQATTTVALISTLIQRHLQQHCMALIIHLFDDTYWVAVCIFFSSLFFIFRKKSHFRQEATSPIKRKQNGKHQTTAE